MRGKRKFSYKDNPFWNVVYRTYPRLLRVLERWRIHDSRQPTLFGHLNPKYKPRDLRRHLRKRGFEDAILAWKDPGEVLSMRRLDGPLYQYHIRLFKDGEIRGHYEHSSEGNPLGHVLEHKFVSGRNFFLPLLRGYLRPLRKKNSFSRKRRAVLR